MRGVTLTLVVFASTQAWAQGGAAPQALIRAAGMPLRVSDLPAGTLTVRVVKGAFSGDLAGRDVRLETADGRSLLARTDRQGRATFRVAAGTEVHAFANVDGERLESETFAMPPDGGVRVLLVAGGAQDDVAVSGPSVPAAAATALPPGHPPIDMPSPRATALAPADGTARIFIALSLVVTTLIGVGLIIRTSPRANRSTSRGGAGG